MLATACTVTDGAGAVAGADAGGGKTDEPDGTGSGGGEGGETSPEESTTGQRLAAALTYGEAVIGTPYGWWLEGSIPQGAPTWASNVAPPAPDEVLAETVNCAGLTNLMMRAADVDLPHHPDAIAGGTYSYERYYELVAQPFDPAADYPTGTLIGRRFRDAADQGHLALVLPDDFVLQSFAWEAGGSAPGANATYTVEESHDGGYYEYAVLPRDWLGGAPDGCERGDGAYCGGHGVVGHPDVLYACEGGVALPVEKCGGGCVAGGEAEPDACQRRGVE